MAYLRLDRLVKSYDGRVNAVDGISIDVAKGEFVTFLGPSGSGKTTTLMMVAGFTPPSAGEIAIDGRAVTGVAPEYGPVDPRPRPIAAPLVFTLLGLVGGAALFVGQRAATRRAESIEEE